MPIAVIALNQKDDIGHHGGGVVGTQGWGRKTWQSQTVLEGEILFPLDMSLDSQSSLLQNVEYIVSTW